jgi:hypothetical protein
MSKITNDRYFTPIHVAEHCWKIVEDYIANLKDYFIIEPSCGDGAFFHNEKYCPNVGIDILIDECNCFKERMIEYDFLKTEFKVNQPVLVIGNPPYGMKMNLAQKFFRHSTEFAEYIAFILPISQLNNTQSLFEFDLIHSEDLGDQEYSGRKLHCCFNVYRRPQTGVLNRRKSSKLRSVKIVRNDSKTYSTAPYDIRICAWGNGTAGKILNDDEHYSAEYKIFIEPNLVEHDEILRLLKTYDWKNNMKHIAMRKIQQFHIINVIKENFPNVD